MPSRNGLSFWVLLLLLQPCLVCLVLDLLATTRLIRARPVTCLTTAVYGLLTYQGFGGCWLRLELQACRYDVITGPITCCFAVTDSIS